MIFKVKDPKQNFEEHLRRLTNQEAFIYFTLDKLIQSLAKLVNNINSDSLTYKILKDETKDYENELKKWAEFTFPSITQQLTRVYRESEPLFRFTYTQSHLMYISMWENGSCQK
jgi:histone deacetylase complex regulatory component SIN3